MIFTIIFCVLSMVGGTIALKNSKNFTATYGIARKDMGEMSWVGQSILRDYNALPASNRPGVDIVSVVRALDYKFGVEKLDDHFRDNNYGDGPAYTYDWSKCRCYSSYYPQRKCWAQEYHELHKSMEAINKALGEQNYRLAIAGHAHGFEQAQDLLERLRTEAGLIAEVTETLAPKDLL
jgi:hypothetical protein